MLGIFLASMLTALALALLAPKTRKEEKKAFATLAMTSIGVAFVANTACGIQHKKMRAKGGLSSYEQSGKSFYIIDIPMNIAIALVAFVAAFRIWCSLVPINL